MVQHELKRDQGLLILTPHGSLEAADFGRVAAEIDPYIEESGPLRGVMICAEAFPGWSDFAALLAHLKVVRDHHRHIERVAADSDSGILAVAPRIAAHFVQVEVRHFAYRGKNVALAQRGVRSSE